MLRVVALIAVRGGLALDFAPAGDDGRCGRAAAYEVLGSRRRIGATGRGRRVALLADAAATGGRVRLRVPRAGRHRHLAVRARDGAGNVGWARPARRPQTGRRLTRRGARAAGPIRASRPPTPRPR